ncbi:MULTISPECIES: hypothetical protein [unclassified Bacillus (in: firmicutes)]|uniref:hypothetical protein n=1 Tax=unclassified Bacillus (in: firmicutes) TaxID=185979 RepID=UPI0008E46447|nr:MULTISPECIES: hypothetical protein [unclassified Bacillus (in: firmicutes)]SFH97774.1 hypothetical protein SAMN04488574_101113 [Bacillus sp. 71mf]SFS94134.1 hypothetical protein SAMN04488145_105177 [Bacillus sp. 103mf]
MKAGNQKVDTMPGMKLFDGEKLLVIISMLGFVLAVGVAVYIELYGAITFPKGDLEQAFSFNAAIALFILSIAAILPITGLSSRKRTAIRWTFTLTTLYAYAVETIQHFRGINPRFTRANSAIDSIAGALFGLDSLLIIIVTVLLAIPFYRKGQMNERPLLVLGIRYALFSTIIAFASGIWMIALQGRYTGEAGNLIVLHGLSFHALQALTLLGWVSERTYTCSRHALRRIHFGGFAWTLSIVLIGLQTALGRSVFELTLLPALSGTMLLIWLAIFVSAVFKMLRLKPMSANPSSHRN